MGFLTSTQNPVYRFIKRFWPVLLALVIFTATTAVVLHLALVKNGGQFVYTLDDPYIHMSIAKNVVQHGVWGITPYHFSSSSSSPLWTLVLVAFYGLFGPSVMIPFLLNLIFAGLAIILVYVLLRKRLPDFINFLALLAVIFFPPLIPLVFSGMEHTAQLFLTLLTTVLAVKALSEDAPSKKTLGWSLVSAFVLTGVRYEGLFLILVLGILFACRKRLRYALIFISTGALPVVAYGLWSLARGWYFLPNPVILKGTNGNQVLINFLENIFVHGHRLTWQAVEGILPVTFISRIFALHHILALFVPSLLIIIFRRGSFWKPANLTNVAFSGTLLLHIQFASTGWFYRYEAYLVAFGVFAIATGLAESSLWREAWQGWGDRSFRAVAILLVVIFATYPLRARAARSLEETPIASHNIFEQQVQMAAFLRQFYQGQAVAANDIGAIDFYADIHLVDLSGLGTRESAAHILKQSYGAPQLAAVADQYHTQIAMVYDSWFQIPREWIKVGEWQIPDNVVCGDSKVSFYAVDPAAAPDLVAAMQAFAPRLPGDVSQRGY